MYVHRLNLSHQEYHDMCNNDITLFCISTFTLLKALKCQKLVNACTTEQQSPTRLIYSLGEGIIGAGECSSH